LNKSHPRQILCDHIAWKRDQPPTEPTTATTSETTTQEQSTESLAPGVTTAGLVNPIALQSAHQQVLLADGFVANTTYENLANGTVQYRTHQQTIAGPGGEQAIQRATDQYRPVAPEFTVRVSTADGVELLEESLGWESATTP
jgi:hypothetical protein